MSENVRELVGLAADLFLSNDSDLPPMNDWLMLESSSDESEYEEFEDVPIPKNSGFFETTELFDNVKFIEHFRISRAVTTEIAQRFEESPFFKSDSGRNGKLSAMQQTLIFLWFAGHQTASFRDVSDRFSISLSSLHRVNCRLIHFLSGLSKDIIKWPSDVEKGHISDGFERMGFPGVIGCIDGSHIKIDTPSVDAISYFNRKKYYSIQLQATCDDRMKITSLFVGFPGSVHDARVFRRSPLGRELQGKCGQYVILGDSAYPASRNLVTPFKETAFLSHRHRSFNKRLSKSRCTIEHSFGLLKQKFRQLYHCKLRNIKTIVHFIRACCVLHNLAIEDHFPEEPVEPNEDGGSGSSYSSNAHDEHDEEDTPDGSAYRDYLLASMFPR